ncbi:hypothetical protein C5167_011581 [Papaver somniferum]|uniref:Uncharacterized protein n=1 Tax=Papaver somniferum TaxID=3469 RepID=A0A4Y7K6Q0_PAPSO|nr:hypothetical protein C5167_011581 [Papaver somniferum]
MLSSVIGKYRTEQLLVSCLYAEDVLVLGLLPWRSSSNIFYKAFAVEQGATTVMGDQSTCK